MKNIYHYIIFTFQILSTMSWVLESLMSYFRGRENDQQRSTSQTSSTPPPSPSPSLAGTNDER